MTKNKIIVLGSSGKMGWLLCNRIEASNEYQLIAKIDIDPSNSTHANLESVASNNDSQLLDSIVVDFSTRNDIVKTLSFCRKYGCSLIVARTDLNKKEEEIIKDYAKYIKIFKSGNFSIGIQATIKACKDILAMLPQADLEIVETHHNKKLDSPSGTANMIKCTLEQMTDKQINTHSLRLGNIVGEHEIKFATQNETIKIIHSAQSKEIFVDGCLKAIDFLISRQEVAGLFTMENII